MISRTLGPEVGGSIGLMFYLANVCGCAVSLLGLVEAVLDTFGAGPCSPPWSRQLFGFAGSRILGSRGREALSRRRAKWPISLVFSSSSCVPGPVKMSERLSWPTGSLPSSWGGEANYP